MAITTVLDTDQVNDHAGQPVVPLTPDGMPYKYKLRRGPSNVYTSTADEILSVVIDDYPQLPPSPDAIDLDLYDRESHDTRVLHSAGVITTLVADAIMSGQLSADEEAVMQRSASFGPDFPPITTAQCQRWDNSDVAMVLLCIRYDRSLGERVPPAGNVVFIDPGVPETYIWDLHRLGVIELTRNPVFRPGGLTDIVTPDQKQVG